MRNRIAFAVATIAVAIGLWQGPRLRAAAEPFKLVAHAETTVTSLTRSQVASVFLGKTSKWSDGSKVIPVDQSATSPIRAAFTRDVLGKSIDEMLNFWQQVVFSGRGVPPKVKTGDQEVLAFVGATPGALAYVAADAPTDKVKVLKIDP